MAVVIPIVTSYRGAGAKAAMRDLGRLQKQAELAGAGTAAGLLGASRSITSFGAGAAAVGMTLTKGITLPVAALGGLAIRESMKFSSAFAGVRKTIDATEPEFAKLRQGIRDMAKEIPASREAIAGVAEAAGQLGIENENVLSFTRTMIDMGESTNLASDEAATALARFANITGMEQTNFDRLGSSIVALGNNMATTEAEVVNFGMRIAGAGAQVGMSEADIMGLSAAFSSVGISAEAGGTALSKTMIGIEASVQKGGGKLKLWAETAGMSAGEFKKAWQEDAAGALTAVVKGLGEMEKQGGSTLGQLEKLGITEVRQRDALLRAAGAGDLLSDALKISGDAWKENGALAEEAGRRYETPESRMAIMKNRASDMGITIGDELMPSFLRLIEGATKLAEKFGNLTDGQQDFIIKAALVGAAIGPVLVIVGRLTQGVGAAVASPASCRSPSARAKAAPGWARGIAGHQGAHPFVSRARSPSIARAAGSSGSPRPPRRSPRPPPRWRTRPSPRRLPRRRAVNAAPPPTRSGSSSRHRRPGGRARGRLQEVGDLPQDRERRLGAIKTAAVAVFGSRQVHRRGSPACARTHCAAVATAVVGSSADARRHRRRLQA